MKLFARPRIGDIDLDKLKVKEIEHFCKTSVIDELVHKELKLDYNKAMGEEMEKEIRFYMVILKTGEYNIISGIRFEAWISRKKVTFSPPQSASAKRCIDHYVKGMVKEHTKAAHLIEKPNFSPIMN